MASSGKIRSTDRSGKKGVSREHSARCYETHPTGGMSGRVNDRQGVSAHLNLHTLLKGSIRRHTKRGCVMRVNEDRRFGDPFHFRRPSNVVNMAVGDENGTYDDSVL